jgi:protein TonB
LVQHVAKEIASTQRSTVSHESPSKQLQKATIPATSAPLQQQSSTPPATIQANPLYRQNPKPTYPPLARRRGWEGTVILLVTVNVLGESEKVRVLKSSGHKILDKSALKTVKKWIFTPGQLGVQPISMEVQVPVHFSIQ